jgi:hypothetical protein
MIASSISCTDDGAYFCIIHFVEEGDLEKLTVDQDDIIDTGPPVETIEEAMAIGNRMIDDIERGRNLRPV